MSRGQDEPESLPQPGNTVILVVRASVPKLPWAGDHRLDQVFEQIGFPHPHSVEEDRVIERAAIVADHVSTLGPYARVKGSVRVGPRESLVGIATYYLEGQYPEETPIGDMVLKKVLEQLVWDNDLRVYICPDYS